MRKCSRPCVIYYTQYTRYMPVVSYCDVVVTHNDIETDHVGSMFRAHPTHPQHNDFFVCMCVFQFSESFYVDSLVSLIVNVWRPYQASLITVYAHVYVCVCRI